MLVSFVGVIDDGTRPIDPSLPVDQRRALTIQQGEDVTVRIKLVNRAGAEIRLGSGEYLALVARTVPSPQSRKLFQKQSVRATGHPANVHDIVIASADTRPLTVTRAIYDVWSVRGASKLVVVPTSELIIARSTADVTAL